MAEESGRFKLLAWNRIQDYHRLRTIVLTGIREIEIRDVPAPMIRNDTDVLLKVEAVGICGSDMHYYTSGRIGDQIVQYPFTIGHECVAMVQDVGRSVSKVKPGDRVSVDPAISCGSCDQCKQGRFHTCHQLQFLGCPGQRDGCLSEFINVPEDCCYPIDSNLKLEKGVLIEPVSIALHSTKLAGNLKGKTIGVLGTGPIGLSVLFSISTMETAKIYATDKIHSRLEFAGEIGASWAGNPEETDVVAEIQGREKHLLDVVFECCGQQEAIDQALELLKPGGSLLIIGIPETDRVSFNISQMRRRELTIRNVRRQNACVEEAIQLLTSHPYAIEKMVTHTFTALQTKDAFELVAGYHDGVIKAIINFNSDKDEHF